MHIEIVINARSWKYSRIKKGPDIVHKMWRKLRRICSTIVLAKPIKPNEFIQFIKINAWNGGSHTDDDDKYIEMNVFYTIERKKPTKIYAIHELFAIIQQMITITI